MLNGAPSEVPSLYRRLQCQNQMDFDICKRVDFLYDGWFRFAGTSEFLLDQPSLRGHFNGPRDVRDPQLVIDFPENAVRGSFRDT